LPVCDRTAWDGIEGRKPAHDSQLRPLASPLLRYRLLFLMTVAGACDRAKQNIRGTENRIFGTM